MENKIVKAAKAAKADGFEYMTSVVKSVYSTIYFNVVAIDDVISKGKWIACQKKTGFGWHGPIGVSASELPDKCIGKAIALDRYCK